MSPEKIAQLFDRFEDIGRSHPTDADRANLLIMKEMRTARVSWLDLLGPLAKPEEVDRRAGTIISGPCLDAFTIPQLALLHLDRLPPRYLAAFAFWRHADLGDRKPIGAHFDLLWDLHQQWRACRCQESQQFEVLHTADPRCAAFVKAVMRPILSVPSPE